MITISYNPQPDEFFSKEELLGSLIKRTVKDSTGFLFQEGDLTTNSYEPYPEVTGSESTLFKIRINLPYTSENEDYLKLNSRYLEHWLKDFYLALQYNATSVINIHNRFELSELRQIIDYPLQETSVDIETAYDPEEVAFIHYKYLPNKAKASLFIYYINEGTN